MVSWTTSVISHPSRGSYACQDSLCDNPTCSKQHHFYSSTIHHNSNSDRYLTPLESHYSRDSSTRQSSLVPLAHSLSSQWPARRLKLVTKVRQSVFLCTLPLPYTTARPLLLSLQRSVSQSRVFYLCHLRILTRSKLTTHSLMELERKHPQRPSRREER